MTRETIIPGADGSEIVVRSLLPGLQRYPLQVRRQQAHHPWLPLESIHLHEAELPEVIRALGGVPSLTDQERIPILLTREQALEVLDVLDLEDARRESRMGVSPARKQPTALSEAAEVISLAIAAQLRALGEGE